MTARTSVAHNQPLGDLYPSAKDKKITAMLQKAAQILEINLLDHIIFNSKGYYLFLESDEL
jgi:DNA repair protein RadC